MDNSKKKAIRCQVALRAAKSLFVWMSATEFAVVLIVILIVVLSLATVLEGARGSEFVQWYVYGSSWFGAIFVLLAINVSAAVFVRFPWKWQQAGFLITHAGLLAVFVGMAQTWIGRIDGRITLEEGAAVDRFEMPYRSAIRVGAISGGKRRWTVYSFAAGPHDWSIGKTLDFGEKNGVALKVLSFRRHAGPFPTDGLGFDDRQAAAQLEVTAGGVTRRLWLDRYGQEQAFDMPTGPIVLQFGHELRQLGFSVRLLEFLPVRNPGGVGYASFVSRVQLVNAQSGVDRVAEITMNRPLTYGGYTIYQLDFHTMPDGTIVSVLSVGRDPGRPLVYVGVSVVCLGTLITIVARGPSRQGPTKAADGNS